jgi:hypothetical protein
MLPGRFDSRRCHDKTTPATARRSSRHEQAGLELQAEPQLAVASKGQTAAADAGPAAGSASIAPKMPFLALAARQSPLSAAADSTIPTRIKIVPLRRFWRQSWRV